MAMALTEERLAAVLAYCKLTELAEDPEVQALIPAIYESAVEYLAEAGAPEPEEGEGRARYDLCLWYLVLDGWERRDATITGTTAADNPAFRRRLNQLKQTQPPNPQTLADLAGGSL